MKKKSENTLDPWEIEALKNYPKIEFIDFDDNPDGDFYEYDVQDLFERYEFLNPNEGQALHNWRMEHMPENALQERFKAIEQLAKSTLDKK